MNDGEKSALIFQFQERMRNGKGGKGPSVAKGPGAAKGGNANKPCYSMQNNKGVCIRPGVCDFNHDPSIMNEDAMRASGIKGYKQ